MFPRLLLNFQFSGQINYMTASGQRLKKTRLLVQMGWQMTLRFRYSENDTQSDTISNLTMRSLRHVKFILDTKLHML